MGEESPADLLDLFRDIETSILVLWLEAPEISEVTVRVEWFEPRFFKTSFLILFLGKNAAVVRLGSSSSKPSKR